MSRPLWAALAAAAFLAACSGGETSAGSVVQVASLDEPGPRLVVEGTVRDAQGAPLAGAVVRLHQPDAAGYYEPPGQATGQARLRGEAVTSAAGYFRFDTIRPGPYPGSLEPTHVHLTVREPDGFEWSRTLWFEGDPLLTAELRLRQADSREVLILTPERVDPGWRVRCELQASR